MIKKQLLKLKENWLLVVLFVVGLLFFSGAGNMFTGVGMNDLSYGKSMDGVMVERMAYSSGMPSYDEGFAPDVQERKISTSLSMSTEVKRGTYAENEQQFKSIVATSNSLIVNENVNIYNDAKSGHYQIKVVSGKAEAVLTQLKKIGEVKSFYTNKQDITNSYTNNKIELESEKERLKLYKQLFTEIENTNEKIQLTNLIFNQERTIKYLEERLESKDQKVDYTTISFSMNEKQSEWTNIALTSLGNLVRNLVDSINTLLTLIFVILPYAVIALLVWLGVRVVNKRR